MRTIAADQVASEDFQRLAGGEILGAGYDPGFILHEVDDPRAAQDAQSGHRRSVREHYRLEIELVDTMRRFGSWPPGVRPARRRVALGATRNRNARELDPGRGSAKGDVVRIVCGQTSITHGADKAEPAEDLHRARGNVIAFHAGWLT